MTVDWRSAFPIQPAAEAVDAVRQAWAELAERPRADFNETTKEPALTKRLKIYVENYTARKRGLLGIWSAEDVFGDIDPATGRLIEERRTDIVYGWNDSEQQLKLVFEFKRLGRQKRHRDDYLGNSGLGRFVDGIYSRWQAVAVMVGVLLDSEAEVVPPIKRALESTALASTLRLLKTPTGELVTRPSALFSGADFDTEHERAAGLGFTLGSIRVSHFFFAFGYQTSTRKKRSLQRPRQRPKAGKSSTKARRQKS